VVPAAVCAAARRRPVGSGKEGMADEAPLWLVAIAPVARSRGTGKSHLITISGESERLLDSCCRKPAHLPGVR